MVWHTPKSLLNLLWEQTEVHVQEHGLAMQPAPRQETCTNHSYTTSVEEVRQATGGKVEQLAALELSMR